jgi:hypothetical protein
MRKVVYLTDQPLDERNYARFGIQTWLDRNWLVEAWDLTPWAHPRVWQSYFEFGNKVREFPGYFLLASKRELAKRVSMSGEIDYFVDLTSENYQSVRAKISLMRAGAIRIVCPGGSIPTPDRAQAGLLRRLVRVIAKGPSGSLKWFGTAFFQKVVAPRIATGLAIVSGEQSIAGVKHCGAIVRTHNFDYDIYLALAKSPRATSERYAVFIDQDYCFHPEYIYQSIRPLATPKKYFPALCNGLKAISDALKVQVRVAAHPRSTYQQRGVDAFAGFGVEYGRTAELIKDCEVVVCHDSTAVQFAVLFGKPTIFVTTDELMITQEGTAIATMAAELGKSPINLDREDLRKVDWRTELHIDAEKYAKYRRRYIKADGSPEMPLWEIVIDHVESAAK